ATRSSSNRMISGSSSPTGSRAGRTRSTRRRSPTSVTRLNTLGPPVVSLLKAPVDITFANLSPACRTAGGRGNAGRVRAVLSHQPMRHERPPHAARAQHGRDHHPGDHLPHPLVQGSPLPLRPEHQGVPQTAPPHGDGFEKLTVVVLRGHADHSPRASGQVENSPSRLRLTRCSGRYSDSISMGRPASWARQVRARIARGTSPSPDSSRSGSAVQYILCSSSAWTKASLNWSVSRPTKR